MLTIQYRNDKDIEEKQVLGLYIALGWSSAGKPEKLTEALRNSHTLISAWDGNLLVGLGNSLSDGHLVAYYPHLLVLPEYQGKGIGRGIVSRLKERYKDFHQQILVADGKAIDFYKNCGFEEAYSCKPLWIYDGHDHD
ncbi:MAG: GNAT family N-acetyltransferase [Desulfobacterales bacterium]|nr:GNAT family N-acetyltransferase [Desulfobacterales bacterium]